MCREWPVGDLVWALKPGCTPFGSQQQNSDQTPSGLRNWWQLPWRAVCLNQDEGLRIHHRFPGSRPQTLTLWSHHLAVSPLGWSLGSSHGPCPILSSHTKDESLLYTENRSAHLHRASFHLWGPGYGKLPRNAVHAKKYYRVLISSLLHAVCVALSQRSVVQWAEWLRTHCPSPLTSWVTWPSHSA